MKKKLYIVIICLLCIVMCFINHQFKYAYKKDVTKNYLDINYQIHLVQFKNGILIDKEMYRPLTEMIYDAQQSGYQLEVISNYHDFHKFYENHSMVYNENEYTKDHQLGLGIDIISINDDSSLQKWLMQHSWRYGFVLRSYDDFFHYRYVGKMTAQKIYFTYATLEGYLKEEKKK